MMKQLVLTTGAIAVSVLLSGGAWGGWNEGGGEQDEMLALLGCDAADEIVEATCDRFGSVDVLVN